MIFFAIAFAIIMMIPFVLWMIQIRKFKEVVALFHENTDKPIETIQLEPDPIANADTSKVTFKLNPAQQIVLPPLDYPNYYTSTTILGSFDPHLFGEIFLNHTYEVPRIRNQEDILFDEIEQFLLEERNA